MFQLRRIGLDTLSEHVVVIHERAVAEGELGFKPLDRVRIFGFEPETGKERSVIGILNFSRDTIIGVHEIGLSEDAFHDLGLPEGARVGATHARAPESVERVRRKLGGARLELEDFEEILADVAARRYSKVELSMFVLACALRHLDREELVSFTRAMIGCGTRLDFGPGPVADKHCIGGVPGNRTTMILVPVLAAAGVVVPKTSSRAITSPSGTADTMGVLAEVSLPPERMRAVVDRVGACIAWGGALDLAPADDVLITVERPMGIDTEAQMIASILAKKKTAGATHALIDIPVGETAKIRSDAEAEALALHFHEVAAEIGLEVDVVATPALGPIGRGVGPRLEALDVLAVLGGDADAPADLREKSLALAARILEQVGAAPAGSGLDRARGLLESGVALQKFEEIRNAQGARPIPAAARHQAVVRAHVSGRIEAIDCLEIASVAKLAGAPAHPASGLRLCAGVGQEVTRGEALFEVHSQTQAQLGFACDYAERRPELYRIRG